MVELAYALPPPDRSFSTAVYGLKQFSLDLNCDRTDSGACAYKWNVTSPSVPQPPKRRPCRPQPPPAPQIFPPRSPSSSSRCCNSSTRTHGRLPSLGESGVSASFRPSADLSVYKSSSSSNTTPDSSISKPAADIRSLSIAIPRAFQSSLDMSALPPPRYFPDAPKASPRLVPGGVVALPKLPGSTWGSESIRATQRVPPRLPKASSIEEYIFKANKELLSAPGSANLVWCSGDGEADYKRLRPEDFNNHFQNNHELTTKVGLANNLLHYSVASCSNIDVFFPRCYDVGRGRVERDDFVLDFRRAAVLKIVLQHLRLEEKSHAYECNLDVLWAAKWSLDRWCRDLDAEHLDEESDPQEKRLGDEDWDALVLYSALSEEQLLGRACQESCLLQQPRRRHARIGGGDFDDSSQQSSSAAARPADVRNWSEFRGHRWGQAPEELRPFLVATTEKLKSLYPQWPLHGGWLGQNVWIVKPGSNSKGSGIECMSTLPELLHHCDTMPNRVVQKYIERPLLLFSGRKFDIRQWVLVRSVAPLKVFLFSECYLRLCNDMYDLGDLRNRERHISNWQVNKHGKNIVEGAAASLQEFREELHEITGCCTFWEEKLLPQMENIVIQTMRSVEGKLGQRENSFELYGFDVMIDESMHMWLLEVNLSPACEGRTPFLNNMLSRMSKRLIEVAVLGKESPDGEKPDWVKICDDAEDNDKARVFDAAQKTMRDLPCSVDLTVQGQQLRMPRQGRTQDRVLSEDAAHESQPRQPLRKGSSSFSGENQGTSGETTCTNVGVFPTSSDSPQSESPCQTSGGESDTIEQEPVSEKITSNETHVDSVYMAMDLAVQCSQSSPVLSPKNSFDEIRGTAESGSTYTTQSPRGGEHDAYSEFEDDQFEDDQFEDDRASDLCSADDDFET